MRPHVDEPGRQLQGSLAPEALYQLLDTRQEHFALSIFGYHDLFIVEKRQFFRNDFVDFVLELWRNGSSVPAT